MNTIINKENNKKKTLDEVKAALIKKGVSKENAESYVRFRDATWDYPENDLSADILVYSYEMCEISNYDKFKIVKGEHCLYYYDTTRGDLEDRIRRELIESTDDIEDELDAEETENYVMYVEDIDGMLVCS